MSPAPISRISSPTTTRPALLRHQNLVIFVDMQRRTLTRLSFHKEHRNSHIALLRAYKMIRTANERQIIFPQCVHASLIQPLRRSFRLAVNHGIFIFRKLSDLADINIQRDKENLDYRLCQKRRPGGVSPPEGYQSALFCPSPLEHIWQTSSLARNC